MLRASSFVFIILLFCAAAAAQDTSNSNISQYTLADLLDQALSHSAWLRAEKARIGEKEYAAKQSSTWQNPALGVSGGVKEVSSQEGPILEATVSQPIFFPGKRGLKKEIADLETEAAKLEYTTAELTLASEVVQAAFGYVTNQHKKTSAVNRQERFRLIRSYLSSQVFASPQKRAESRIVDSRVRNVTTESLQIDATLRSAFAKLQFYVPITKPDPLRIDLPWLQGQKILDAEAWQNKILERNIDLASQLLAVTSAKTTRSLTKKEAWPDFAVSAFYTHEDAGGAENAFGGGLTVPLPLWNRNTWASKSAAKKIEASEHTYDLRRQQLAATTQQLLAEYEAARKIVAQYPESLFAEWEKQIQETELEFRKGRIDLLTFLELDSEVADTYAKALEAQTSLVEKIATLSLLAADSTFIKQLSSF